MKLRGVKLAAAVAALAILAALQARATLSFTLDAANVALTGPFGTVDVTLDPTDNTKATVTLTASGVYSFGDGTTLGLNLSSIPVAVTGWSLTGRTGGGSPTLKSIVQYAQNIDGWGLFNFAIDLDDGYGSSATSVTLHLQNATAWASENDILALNSSGYSVVGHVMSPTIDPMTGDNITGFAVPEPTTLVAGALLLIPFGASTLRILRKNRAV